MGSLFALVFSGLSGLEGGGHMKGFGRRRRVGEERESVWRRQFLAAAGRDDQTLWRERGEGTSARGWWLVWESRGYIHGIGAEEGGERREAKAAVKVGDEACLRKTAEGEECGMRRG